MLTNVRFWIGALATITLVSCAIHSTDTQLTKQPASADLRRVTTTDAAPVATETAAAADAVQAAKKAAAEEAARVAEEAARKAAAEGNITVSIPTPNGETLLLERIAYADAIVRAEFVSVSPVVDSFTHIATDDTETTLYGRGLAHTFKVLEYLKGSGGNQIVAVSLDYFNDYATKADADAASNTYPADRDPQWDSREAVLFLFDWRGDQADRYGLGALKGGMGLMDYYSIASRWDKLWLPSVKEHESGTTRTYMMDVDGATITLAALKTKIAGIAAEVAAGDGTAAYEDCIYKKYFHLRNVNHLGSGPAGEPHRFAIGSGLAKGTRVNLDFNLNIQSASRAWLEGDNADLFEVNPVGVVKTLRPLPEGAYMFTYIERNDALAVCDAPIPDSQKKLFTFAVDAAAPDGVLHELFFDPVTVGTTVAADSANGVLKPATFTDANGASATIESISYEPPAGSGQTGTVKLEVDPHTGLADHVVDFIELDGSVSLSLRVADATVDAANDTLSWSASSQPWHDGDMLMVRIREGLPYAPAPQGLSVSLSDDTFTISWSAVAGADQYRVGHRAGGSEGEWTDLDATTGTSQMFSPEGGAACGTTYDFRVQAQGNGETHVVAWGAASEPVSHTTGACNRAPVFGSSSYSFSVAENAPVWHSVGTVSATDPDQGDEVLYYITAGNGGGRFNIASGRSGGLIVVWGALDYETASSYTLTVEARDGKAGGTSSTTVEITVTDVAEGTPPAPDDLAVSLSSGTFAISWSGVTGAGQYRVQHRTGGSAGTWTSLDATTGTSQTFSPEGGPSCGTTYDFRVQAQGDGETHVVAWGAASEPVSHTTGACNRAPAFGSATYSFSVSEDAATGTAVGTVSATDPDEGDSVAYSITAGNGEGRFSIGGSGGSITVAGSLDYETTLSYTLTVQATDGDSGTATATVKISVTDVSEAAPPPPTNLTTSYNPAAGSFGFTWQAVAGADMYRVQYRAGGAEGTWTNLEATTSTGHTFIPVGGPLCGTTYEFHIQARGDGETYPANWSSRSSSVTYATPACNRAPAFGSATYDFTVSEDAATGTAVGTVSATDPDDGDSVTYSITAGNGDGKFSIDGSGGGITVAGSLDYETTSSYTLTVQASDGKADGASTATVEISVGNVAESPPPAPQNLTATATHNSVTLSWTAPDDSTVTGYQILRRRPDHGETELLVHVSDTGSTQTTYTDSALQPRTRYVYRVKAINAAGVGPFSNRVTATTAAQP